mmetsp:Transcript_2019/g.12919  ORF Transcript_2019/g.12919 Transcript_2019/m.12919 type:complete len:163 (-) Transcript_2019:2125-2613(-)
MQITSAQQIHAGRDSDHDAWKAAPAQCMHQDIWDVDSYHGCSKRYMPSVEFHMKRMVNERFTFDVRHVSNKTDASCIYSFHPFNLNIHEHVAAEGCWQQTWESRRGVGGTCGQSIRQKHAKTDPRPPANGRKVQGMKQSKAINKISSASQHGFTWHLRKISC